MEILSRKSSPGRREFLRLLTAGAIVVALPGSRLLSFQKSGSKPLRGIFPIAHTPFTDSNQLDLATLVKEVEFIDRGGVHGFVWPQMASETLSLTDKERSAGAEAIITAGKRLRPAIVVGIQGPDLAAMQRYAKEAERLGADAVISLPPGENATEKDMLQYYQAVGRATSLPIVVQAVETSAWTCCWRCSKAFPTCAM